MTGRASAPRDRILAAASELFLANGTDRTGVDRLIEAAGVAKATFYRHFPSKDDLILAWLQHPGTRWFHRLRAQVEREAATADEVVPELFDAVAVWLEAGDFTGCAYLNTALEISDQTRPPAVASRAYLAEIGQYLEQALAEAGYRDADRLGPEVHALLAGGITLGVANRSTSYLVAARDAAMQLLATSRRG
jgi:AcrR family transcriptional regulator